MRSLYFCLFAIVAAIGMVCAEEPKEKEKKQEAPEDLVRAGITHFREQMQSDDAKVREAEFDKVIPDQKTFERLFGDDANQIWPRYSESMKKMRAATDKIKEEFDRKGKMLSIELIDVRKNDDSGRYQSVLQVIPKEIPVYRAITKYEKGSGGSSSYLVIDGSMRFVQGLESIPEIIEEQKKAKK